MKRGPVEFNHAISYVNKIKVSSTPSRNWGLRPGSEVKALISELP